MRYLLIIASLLVLAGPDTLADEKSLDKVSGVIKAVGTDHIMIQGPGLLDRKLMIGETSRIALPVTQEDIDTAKMLISKRIPFSGPDWDSSKDEKVEFPAPEGLWLSCEFRNMSEYEKLTKSTPLVLQDYELLRKAIDSHIPDASNMQLAGKLFPGEKGTLRLKVGESELEVALKGKGRLTGFSLKDLKPFIYDVFASGKDNAEAFEVKELLLEAVGDQARQRDPKLPSVLVIGDSISLGYTPILRQALKGKANVFHPPTNCGSGSMHKDNLHRWLGVFTESDRKWDVITFNFGHWDSKDSKEEYLKNLQNDIDLLTKTGAKLIWVTTTPVNYGNNLPPVKKDAHLPILSEKDWPSIEHTEENPVGNLPGRSRLTNTWAAELLTKYPEIAVCDQWQLVKNNEKGFYRDWWHAQDIHFFGRNIVPAGRELARKILEALGHSGEEINPMSVHGEFGIKVPELSSEKPVNAPVNAK
ncbi:MAG: hypothetical protein A2X49_04285 [Lentisphaerae bacterium GWF2_52_8]|nr:MAG: hypothetical protein A2X49_04285 [Lentisphaerae bacterium GWF2_52_8]